MSGPRVGANFVAMLTPAGVAGIATIRLVGPAVAAFAATHLSKPLRENRCVYADLREGERVIDDVVAVKSDTGTLDLSVHGGPWVIEATLDLARRFGFEQRAWDDAAFQAADSPDDELTREMLSALPHASTTQAIAILLAQPGAWRTMLQRRDPAEIERAMSDRSLEHLLRPPTVAIVGAPNVGKSTLANQLFARDHAITADLPGTTRDWVGARANLDGLVVTLIDTPGHRETADAIERQAIDRAEPVIRSADLVIHVLDVTQPLGPQSARAPVGSARRTVPINSIEPERAARQTLQRSIVALNKMDQPPAWDTSKYPAALLLTARTGAGIDALRQAIGHHFDCSDLISLHARCWTNRQRERLAAMRAS